MLVFFILREKNAKLVQL